MKLSIAIALLCLVLFVISWADAREIGFVEDFSLSGDRAEALKQLIPGSSDYYYYHCLHAQHTGDFEKVHKMLELWIRRDSYTGQVREILNRQALLEYESNPGKSLDYIKNELNLRFDHRKEIASRETDYPTTLSQELISIPYLTKRAFSKHKNLQGIEDPGLDILEHHNLNSDQQRDLLQRLQIPDIPDLAKLVTDDLRYKHSSGFGSLPIHSQMIISQLDECLRLMPELKDNFNFITTYVSKLGPSDDTDLRYNHMEKKAYFDRLWGFARELAPAHNSLKAHVLYQILDMNRKQIPYLKTGYDHDLFMTYIRLPRNVPYMDPKYLKRTELRHVAADLNADFSKITRTAPIVTDEELVRDYLSHYFLTDKDYRIYEKFIKDTYLKNIFAETKIVNNLGDMEQWYSMLDPDQYQALKEQVDLEFAHDNRKYFATHEPVALDLYVKNIKTLIVKIFELNTFNFYQANLKEVDTAVNLDGLVPAHERVIKYDDPPLRRIRRTFEFPELDRPGVFVAEFIGNGKSSRAMIRKGQLYFVEKIGPAGHEFMVRDEMNKKRPGASVWMAGREYKPGEDGIIIIPFSNKPGRQNIILKDNDFCSLALFDHLPENYNLSAGFYADPESLLRQFKSKVIVRPFLTLNKHPVSLSLLENIRLIIESCDHEGVSSSREVPDFEVSEDRESVFEFQVPDNPESIRFKLVAYVRNISRNEKERISARSEKFYLNQIDKTKYVYDIFLSHADNAYMLELLGKNGEPVPNRSVNVRLKHRYFREEIHVQLQTDSAGRIHLGRLEGIEQIKADGPNGVSHTWNPVKTLCHYPANIHGQAGENIQIPLSQSPVSGPRFSVLEKRGQTYVADLTGLVRMHDGFLDLSGLGPGNYEVFLKQSRTSISIRLTEGKTEQGFVISDTRVLEMTNEHPLQISSIDADKESLKIKLGNASEFARVHVLATRFMPVFHIFSKLDHTGFPEPYEMRLARPESQYVAGRNIGDEYRYILDRKYAEKFPGNMLNRPELLLNPWSVRKTGTVRDEAGPGGAFASEMPDQAFRKSRGDKKKSGVPTLTSFSNFNFLAEPSAILVNLRPDEHGVVTIDRKQITGHRQVHVIAADLLSTLYQEISLPETGMKTRDLRFARELDPEKHFTEQRQVSVITPCQTFEIADITTSEFEVYDSLDKIYQLMVTLSNNPTLREFGFILDWPDMDDKEKQEKYSKYACHELSFFIFHKDRKFFDAVILPYIQNKKDKTFMDYWLLGDDLTPFLEPRAFSQLNIVEKILLARRGPDDGDWIARYVRDLYDMIPLDTDAYNHLFDTALKGRALEQDLLKVRAVYELGQEDMLREPEILSEGLEAEESYADSAKMRWKCPRCGYVHVGSGPPDACPICGSPSSIFKEYSEDEVARESAPAPMKSMTVRRMRKPKSSGGWGDHTRPPRAEERKEMRSFFRKLDKTEEWVENNYYKLPIEQQNADLITVNAFWNDYADQRLQRPFFLKHLPCDKTAQKAFFSKNFAYASRNFAEMMLALSVLDIPFRPGKHEPKLRGTRFSLSAESPMIVFHKELRHARASEEKIPILASQQFFQYADRYRYVGNERSDKYAEDEFLVQTAYGCQVVLSNPSSSLRKLRVLLQIPQGAMPLDKGFFTKGIPMTLEPYATQTFEYYFYFPETGKFGHYPMQVAKDEQFVTSAPGSEMNVVDRLTRTDTESWDYVSQNSEKKDVLEFLHTHNLNRLDLEKIAFRMKEKAFFEKTIRLLRDRHVYDHTLWSYSIFHNDPEIIPEYLEHSDYADQCGYYIDTLLLKIDPRERKTYQHMEYKPLVNARAHQLGRRQKILNDRFYDQYHRFMKTLSYRPLPDNNDLMAVTYYLLLQDRVSEALDFFNRIHLSDVMFSKDAVSQPLIQYDYLKAYLGFYTGDIGQSRTLAAKYADYPVPRWRNLFRTVADQLDELEGKDPEIADKEDRGQIHAKLADTEKSLDFKIESKRVTINYQNLDSCSVNYYPMDIELLFSRNPFVQQQTGHFAFIRPNETTALILPASQTSFTYELPEKFHNSNLMAEVVAGPLKKSQAYYANSLDIQVIENYGHLKVSHQPTHKPVPGTYVKVYARMKQGEIQFCKDGYTDLRGKFDYVSLNTDELDHVEKFAILILSEDYGAVIRNASPPKR